MLIKQKACLCHESRDVETNCWDRCDYLTQLQLVQDGGLTCSIQPDHQDAHFRLADQPLPYLCESKTHGFVRKLTISPQSVSYGNGKMHISASFASLSKLMPPCLA